jgi:hypothetical protein
MRIAILCTVLLLLGDLAHAQTPARVLAVRGAARVINEMSKVETQLVRGMVIQPPSTLVTDSGAAVRVRLADGSIISLGSSTRMKLDRFDHKTRRKRRARFKLAIGRMWAKVTGWLGGDSRYEIETGNAVAGVRGTEFVVHYDENGVSSVLVVSGTLSMQNTANEIAERIGPFFAGLLSGEGTIVVKELELEQLRAAAEDVHIGPQLSDEELAALEERRRRRGALDDLTRQLPLDLLPRDTPPAPDIPLEPGVGRSSATGRVEVRDDP